MVWDLPYGKGRHFGANAPLLSQMLLGNWQISAINTTTSGQPVNLTYYEPAASDVSDLLAYRPNVTGNPVTPSGQRIKTATASRISSTPALSAFHGPSQSVRKRGAQLVARLLVQ